MKTAIFVLDNISLTIVRALISHRLLCDNVDSSSKEHCILNRVVGIKYITEAIDKNIFEQYIILHSSQDESVSEIEQEKTPKKDVTFLNVENLINLDVVKLISKNCNFGLQATYPESLVQKIIDLTYINKKLRFKYLESNNINNDFFEKNKNLEKSFFAANKKINWLRSNKNRLEKEKQKSKLTGIKLVKQLVVSECRFCHQLAEKKTLLANKLTKNKNIENSLEYILVANSSLFDASWYNEKYPDVFLQGIDPVKHFLLIGWKEGRDPSKYFDTSRYLEDNKDVRESNTNPLLHFLKYGILENRKFDWEKLC